MRFLLSNAIAVALGVLIATSLHQMHQARTLDLAGDREGLQALRDEVERLRRRECSP